MKKRKFALTLIETMVVIVIIGLVGSVIAYNVRGSLEKGKRFKTDQAVRMLEDIVSVEVATNGVDMEEFLKSPEDFLKRTGMVKDPKSMLCDGWGKPFEFSVNKNGELVVKSPNYSKK